MLDFEEIENHLNAVEKIIGDIKKIEVSGYQLGSNTEVIAQEKMRMVAHELSVTLRHENIALIKPWIQFPSDVIDALESNLMQLKIAYNAELERHGWKRWNK